MTIKVTAVLTFACAVLLYVLSALSPNAPYFYLISGGIALAMIRLALAALALALAFQTRFSTVYGQTLAGLSGAALLVFGTVGIMIPAIDYTLFNYIKPLDYIFLMQLGVLFSLAALSHRPGNRRMPRLSRPRHPQLSLFRAHEV